MTPSSTGPAVVIGLSAVVLAIRDGEAVVLTVRPRGQKADAAGGELKGLPFGPFDPQGHRTFELAMRAFVTEQTGFDLGYVEQLYTFGDKGRDAPLADMGDGSAADRVLSFFYNALAPPAIIPGASALRMRLASYPIDAAEDAQAVMFETRGPAAAKCASPVTCTP